MSSDIVLTSALRNNLLSLQNTQRLIDNTQFRLATGLKVNSALDNPQNFFAAQALNNRASDLSRLLDGISQSIRTVESANSGVEALTGLIEQADSIVNSARDILAASEGEAIATGGTDLSAITDLVAGTAFDNGDQFTISTVADTGTQVTETITVNTGDTAESLAAKITNAFADNQNDEITARVTSDGFFQISSADGRSFRIEDTTGGTASTLTAFQNLGLGDVFADEDGGTGAAAVAGATIVSGNTITSRSIFEAPGDLIEAGDEIVSGAGVAQTYQDADGTNIISGFQAADTIAFTVNGTQTATYTVANGDTFQDIIDAVNSNTTVNELIEASFDSNNGQLNIRAIGGSTDSVEITVTGAGAVDFNVGFGDPSANFDPLVQTTAGNAQDRIYAFSTGSSELEAFAIDFNEVRNQIDRLVNDASYRGVNLLQGDDLVTNFNEDRTSVLTTQGVDFSANGLGITDTTFSTESSVDLAAEQTREALDRVRAFGSSLSNDLAIITARRNFTENTINTLESGADDLTVADQNEEGANLLALQTRQALGTTALSLASQSAQSVLRLF